ncbi:unnamed protein product, partial [Mesorhabditis spiculigera]
MGASERVMNTSRKALAVLLPGLLVSLYGVYVEINASADPDYRAACDFTAWISCTRALNSAYSRGFGLVEQYLGADNILNQPNAIYGVFGYTFLAFLQLSPSLASAYVSLLAAIVMNMSTVYLFIAQLHLGVVCIVCYSIYVVNFVFLIITLKRRNAISTFHAKKNI